MCGISVDVDGSEDKLIDCSRPELAQGLELLAHTALPPIDLTDEVEPEHEATTDSEPGSDKEALVEDLDVITADVENMLVIGAEVEF